MKKFSLLVSSAVVSLGMLVNANAATQNSAGMFEVNLPNFQQNWFKLYVQGVYFQPTIGQSNYAVSDSGVTTSSNFGSVPSWHWGWGVGAAWYIAGTSNDVAFNYFNYSTANDSNTVADPTTPANTDSVSVTSQANIYDLSLGQNINIGKNLNARAFVGGRFANLRAVQDMTPVSSSAPNQLDTTSTILNVGGPRVGLEGIYFLGAGFGIAGSADAAVLIGSSNVNAAVGSATLNYNSQTVAIPNFGIKLGLNYSYQDPSYAATFEVGYRADTFRNVVQSANNSGILDNDNTATPATGDLSFQGPYAQLSVVF